MSRFISISALLGLLVLPGCATMGAATGIATDSFCISAKKRGWSLEDTPESIRAARIWNKTIDQRCGSAPKEA